MATSPFEDLVFVGDHPLRMSRRMLSQFWGQPNIDAFFKALGQSVQALEDEAFGVLISTTFTAAVGHDLDVWGALVGEPRGSFDDEDYRVFIQARQLANLSTGRRDEMIAIWQLVTAPYLDVRHTDHYPASIQFDVLRADPMSAEQLARAGQIMRAAKPGGVGIALIESITGYFGFDEDVDSEPYDIGLFSRAF